MGEWKPVTWKVRVCDVFCDDIVVPLFEAFEAGWMGTAGISRFLQGMGAGSQMQPAQNESSVFMQRHHG